MRAVKLHASPIECVQEKLKMKYAYDPNNTYFPKTAIENGRINAPPQFSYTNAPEPTGPISIIKQTPGQSRITTNKPVA
ncbi:hypothetical protein TSAR_014908 [Trichomalopsis sarcophagae]|uniref:Uncharacterized protein n=1 Tax=Trichomalopsis sarcophagae TaxID=543379 RepID=A0A232F3D1_9HYME|nr:hypothetical protein TSAR_014908 [Trichomalopsis sarcophagae]